MKNIIESDQLTRTRNTEQEQLVGYWVKRFGISKRDLDSHPQIDDVLLLIQWHDEFYAGGKRKHKKFFDNTWRWVYNGKYPLKAKQLRTLGYYAQAAIAHRKNVSERTQAQRLRIQAQRNYRKNIEAQL
jgi:hypothetical protein